MNIENMIQGNPQALVKSVNGIMVADNFCGELQQWSMKNFSIKDGVIRHNRLPLIMDVFIKGAHNPHKGIATHG